MEKLKRKLTCLLGKNPEGLEFLDILVLTGEDSEIVYKCLKALQENRSIRFFDRLYNLTESSKNTTMWKAKCPFCGTIRIITNPNQGQVRCANYDCKSKSGRHRTFWIYTVRMRKKGLTKRRINLAD